MPDQTAGSAPQPGAPNGETEDTRLLLERGLRFGHVLASVDRAVSHEAVVAIQALAQVLIDKGFVEPDEFNAARSQAREELEKVVQPRVRLGRSEDKYAAGVGVEIDCAARIHLCHARCCTFNFYLTEQDLDEGVARWDYGNPYWIRRRADGYCTHCDPTSRACAIHAERPYICRLYDCRTDKRVWLDFEARIPAPMPALPGEMAIGIAEFTTQEMVYRPETDGKADGGSTD
jgi:Fe-S-cluster containining protein